MGRIRHTTTPRRRILAALLALAAAAAGCASTGDPVAVHEQLGTVRTPRLPAATPPAARIDANLRGRPAVPPPGIVWRLQLVELPAGGGSKGDRPPLFRLRLTLLDARLPEERNGAPYEPDLEGIRLLDDRGVLWTPSTPDEPVRGGRGDGGGSSQAERGRQSTTWKIDFVLPENDRGAGMPDLRTVVVQWRLTAKKPDRRNRSLALSTAFRIRPGR